MLLHTAILITSSNACMSFTMARPHHRHPVVKTFSDASVCKLLTASPLTSPHLICLTPQLLTEAGSLVAGNGSQWPRMAAELVEASPTFRSSIQACADALKRYGVDLLAEFGRADGWSTPALAMAGLSAVQVRSFPWLPSVGIR